MEASNEVAELLGQKLVKGDGSEVASTPGTELSRVKASTSVFTTVLTGLPHQDSSPGTSRRNSTIPSKALTMAN